MTQALVTGASGFLGRHVVALLRERGVRVLAFVRPSSHIDGLRAPGVEIAYGDATDPLPDDLCKGIDLVFHLAAFLTIGAPFGVGNEDPRYQIVNVDFTERLLAAAYEAGVSRFMFSSSSSVYALGAPVPTPEDGPLCPLSSYGRSKLAAERRVHAYQEQGLPATIVRPAVIYGPGDRYFVPTMLALARLPLLPLIGGGRGLFDMIYVRDVAELLWEAAQTGAGAGRIYNAGPGRPTTIRDLVSVYRQLTGRGPRVLKAPRVIMRRTAFLSRPLLAHLAPGAEAALTPTGIELMEQDFHLEMDRAARELGYRPRFSLEEGLARTLEARGKVT